MKHIISGICISTALLLSSCSDWVNVSSKEEVEADKMFINEIGFQQARIGLYTRMTLEKTYGKDMTYRKIEELVQRYDNYGSNVPTDNERAQRYDYKNNTDAKDMVKNLWLELFKTIANANELLFRLDNEGRELVSESLWKTMKGEALGLRAFHYFDLLRLYGPIYKEDSTMRCLPWRDRFDDDRKTLLPANEIAGYILRDLNEAENLLASEKPLTGSEEQTVRRHYMNKWAVKALKARVYQWIGKNEEAVKEAQAVIDSCGLELSSNNQQDVSMFNETIFALGMDDMEEKLKSDWAEKTTFANELYISPQNATDVFETETIGYSDIRYSNGWGFVHGTNGLLCRKYLGKEAEYKEKVPLIRLVEMYLIIAECGSLENSVNLINTVRHERGIPKSYDIKADASYNKEKRENILNKEYQKEFFAEGQWFYFLKRHNCSTFYRCPVEKMIYYILPTPEDEIEYGI